ncbi:hypothetical protein VH441_02105 [Psychrobacter sp. HD31]|uniref:hypothetical protein n=1 Tax=Psychrobacter sp. HD31 TaxID=3112003 RepID=UPI003DA63B0A
MLTKNQQKGDTFTVFILFLIALMVVALLVAIFAFQIGYSSGFKSIESENDVVINGQLVTARSLEAIEEQNKQFKTEADVAKQERDISLDNLKSLRVKLTDLETNNLQLQRTVEMFSSSIAKQGGIPLQVVGAKIEPLPENAFEYRFDVAMVNENGEYTQLVPKLTLLNNTSFVNIPLSPSTYEIKGISYIRGRFVMPEGFKPVQLKLSLSAGDQTKEQIYNWRLGKKKADMPMSLSQVPDVNNRPITSEDKN